MTKREIKACLARAYEQEGFTSPFAHSEETRRPIIAAESPRMYTERIYRVFQLLKEVEVEGYDWVAESQTYSRWGLKEVGVYKGEPKYKYGFFKSTTEKLDTLIIRYKGGVFKMQFPEVFPFSIKQNLSELLALKILL
jgi:hypothetical protein